MIKKTETSRPTIVRYSAVGLAGLLFLARAAAGYGSDERWWNERWDHRCSLNLEGKGAALLGVPVIIRGEQIRSLAGTNAVSTASLRVVRQGREVPCQFDELPADDFGAPLAAHGLDDADELVFQADLPATGKTTCWLYWNSLPLEPGAYPSRTLIGDALEPAAWQHDIQLWNDQCLVGMRGPARGEDPAKNQIENWGAGALTQLHIYRQKVLNIQSGWTSVFPRGAFAGGPCTNAARWSCPRKLVNGPVRVAATCVFTNAEFNIKNQPPAKADIVHRVWLYERGAYVCFDEIIRAREAIRPLTLAYETDIDFARHTNEIVWYSMTNVLSGFVPTEPQLQDANKSSKIILQASDFDPWIAGYSIVARKGYAMVFDAGPQSAGEERVISCFSRLVTTVRFNRKIQELAPGQSVRQRFWVVGLEGPIDGTCPLATWRELAAPQIEWGPVERRGR